MIKKRKKFPKKYYESIAYFFILLVMSLLFFFLEKDKGTMGTEEAIKNVVFSILCSIIASGIFTVIQKYFDYDEEKYMGRRFDIIEERLKRQDQLYDSGIISIYPKGHFDYEVDYWNDIINNTNNRLDLTGHSISNWFKNDYKDIFKQKVKNILESGNKVNIILSYSVINFNKINEIYKNNKANFNLTKTERTILNLRELLDEVSYDKRKNLRVYINKLKKISYLYIRTDNQCIFSPYVYSKESKNNNFLLELKPGTSYVISLEDDFEEMINCLEQLDLYTEEKINDDDFIEIKHIETDNRYCSKNWNYERTYKYIFLNQCRKYEVGYFEHYKDSELIKLVIELPVSFGCPSKCKFCASSNINDFFQLTSEKMKALFEKIYIGKNLKIYDHVVLSMTGMGDLAFNSYNVFSFLLSLRKYQNLSITLSSSFWTDELLEMALFFNEKRYILIHHLQFTYISNNEYAIKELVPIQVENNKIYKLSQFVNFVLNVEYNKFRINYILIEGVNDSDDDINSFIDTVKVVKDKVIVRLSKLNETKASKRNLLKTIDGSKIDAIINKFENEGISCYAFYSYENDNMNCGQLITEL